MTHESYTPRIAQLEALADELAKLKKQPGSLVAIQDPEALSTVLDSLRVGDLGEPADGRLRDFERAWASESTYARWQGALREVASPVESLRQDCERLRAENAALLTRVEALEALVALMDELVCLEITSDAPPEQGGRGI